ncbi:NUDIX domain-containing protein [Streptomyces antimycoticus]|uniref:NUDIX domain-containing protein n=1 Tax=Streptomyces antimycoticus TaxID=68175 RepID=UPI0036EB152C
MIAGAIREAAEEVGVELNEAALDFVHVVHHRNGDEEARIGFFFPADNWRGQPTNREPHKCARLLWADPTDPPANTVPYNGRRPRECFQCAGHSHSLMAATSTVAS